MDVFKEALKSSKNPVCYNGDIFNSHDYKRVVDECSDINAVMLGRGIITNPGLIKEITDNEFTDKKNLKKFHDEVYLGYKEILSGDKNVLFKMKEFWFYMINVFEESEKIAKKIKKAKSANEYEAAVSMLFNDVDTK